MANNTVLDVKDLKVYFPINRGFIFVKNKGYVKAVDGVDLSISPGETLGLVGESGSGKTTVGKAIIRLVKPTSGNIQFNGGDVSNLKGGNLREFRKQVGFVFQDPYGSLNPRMTAERIISEPLLTHKIFDNEEDRRKRVLELLDIVGLHSAMISRYPHEFSGGQRQRIGIARAIAANPELIILDEPVSALDVSIQAQIINLLEDLQKEFNIAYLFIAHDLSVVRHVSDRVAVMYLGHIVEYGDRDKIYNSPVHPYTRALLSAVPVPDPEIEAKRQRTILEGDIPSPTNPPSGCVFRTRCPEPSDECKSGNSSMGLIEHSKGHWVDQCCANCG
ncbi:MAG: ABC transporter ATP-binding protein [Dehalococcoidia bacterium]